MGFITMKNPPFFWDNIFETVSSAKKRMKVYQFDVSIMDFMSQKITSQPVRTGFVHPQDVV